MQVEALPAAPCRARPDHIHHPRSPMSGWCRIPPLHFLSLSGFELSFSVRNVQLLVVTISYPFFHSSVLLHYLIRGIYLLAAIDLTLLFLACHPHAWGLNENYTAHISRMLFHTHGLSAFWIHMGI